MKKSSSSGFSLTELCVVTVTISVMSMASYPMLSSMKKNQKLRSELQHACSFIMLARTESIKQNADVTVVFKENEYYGFVDNGGGGGTANDRIKQHGEREIFNHMLADGITLWSNYRTKKVTFRSRIGIWPGTLKFFHEGKAYGKVVLNVTGRVRVEKL